jgi:hypothetical protein
MVFHLPGASVVRRLTFALLVLTLAACQTATPATSGLQGQVLIGPMCPVVQQGTPCPDQPYAAAITVRDSAGREVTTFQSDAQGNFKVNLNPGAYTLVPVSPDGFTHAAEQVVDVIKNQYLVVTITYDSGIR